MKQRLQKLIAAAGLASRREAERWIEAGQVTVNGRVATLGESADPASDEVAVRGKPLAPAGRHYYVLLYKPVGYVSTRRDPQGRPVVTELVKVIPERLYPVGRLDLNTEGLLLLTNDGQLAHRLMHPSHQVDKTYLVRVRGSLSPSERKRLETGVRLEDGITAPARVENLRRSGSHTWFELTIREGRNRQVRRMCEALGHPVSRLKRIRIAFLQLGDLTPGTFRHLTSSEIARLQKL